MIDFSKNHFDITICVNAGDKTNLPAGVNWDIGFNVGGDFGGIHVRGVLEISTKTMVFTDEWVKNISEVNVRIFVTSIDTAMLVVELNCAGNSLGQSELRGLGNNFVELVPFVFSHVLGNQGVLGLDFGERSHGPDNKEGVLRTMTSVLIEEFKI